MKQKKVTILGCEGFIGKNLVEHYLNNRVDTLIKKFNDTSETSFKKFIYPYVVLGFDKSVNKEKQKLLYPNIPTDESRPFLDAVGNLNHLDLTVSNNEDMKYSSSDIIIQAAATTSGANDIINKPYYHVTDNAIMNSLLLQKLYNEIEAMKERFALYGDKRAEKPHTINFIFLSCTVMYPQNLDRAVHEDDFNGEIYDKYFGVGWTKVYIEKLCEFYSRLLPNVKFTIIRHSNVYGPHDKFDLARSHVIGATINKVLSAPNGGEVEVWGDGSELRDFLYIDDLVDFINAAVENQEENFAIVNVGSGTPISVKELVETVIKVSRKDLKIRYNTDRPSLKNSLWLNTDIANERYKWEPKIDLEEGIEKTIDWIHNKFFNNGY